MAKATTSAPGPDARGRPGAAASWAVVVMLTATTLASSATPQPHAIAGVSNSVLVPAVRVVDAAVTESSYPPVGRSLFDHVFARRDGARTIVDVPFPFSRLVQRLEEEVAPGPSGATSIRKVMIPLGRSLQRTAAAPAYFTLPRVVVAVDGQPRSGRARSGEPPPLLKDRLYLGYQEAANVLEVISYNESAGRFEFQLVRDYRAGGTREVAYANRALCTACHQNAGPVFSRALWSETHANPAVAGKLSQTIAARYGVDLAQGIDVPFAIDAATDRANELAAYQWLWRHGCDADGEAGRSAQCRGALLLAVLQHRLGAGQGFDETDGGFRAAAAIVADNGRKRWPGGLAIPDPDLPNRDPFAHVDARAIERGHAPSGTVSVAGTDWAQAVNITSAFDPLVLRPSLEIWPLAEPESTLRRLVAGLAGFLSDEDVARLDDHLVRTGPGASLARSTSRFPCAMRSVSRQREGVRIDFRCKPLQAQNDVPIIAGRLHVVGTRVVRGSIDSLLVPGEAGALVEVRDIDIAGGSVAVDNRRWSATLRLARGSLNVRAPDGSRVGELQLQGEAPSVTARDTTHDRSFAGMARVTVLRDFVPVREAIAAIVASSQSAGVEKTSGALADAPFRRVTVLRVLSARLALTYPLGCCEDGAGLPPALVDAVMPIASGDTSTPDEMLLHRHCALCHRTRDPFPPNFLAGGLQEVRDRIAHCAPRIYVRLAMWRHGDARQKSPMPPASVLSGAQISEAAWRSGTDLTALTDYIGEILQKQTGKSANADELLSGGYERLRGCLPKTG